jgi:hypothetical protein
MRLKNAFAMPDGRSCRMSSSARKRPQQARPLTVKRVHF